MLSALHSEFPSRPTSARQAVRVAAIGAAIASWWILALSGCHSSAAATTGAGEGDHASRASQSAAPARPCVSDRDCAAQRCAGCRCISLRVGEPAPANCGPAICAADPCTGATAVCDPASHTCRLSGSGNASPGTGSAATGSVDAGVGDVCGGSAGARCPAGQSCVFAPGSDRARCQRNGTLGTRCEGLAGCDPGLVCAHDQESTEAGECRAPGARGTPCASGTACAPGTTCTRSPDGRTSLCRRPGDLWTACEANGPPGRRCQAWTVCVSGGAATGLCRELPRNGGPCGAASCAPNEVCCDPSRGPCARGPFYGCP